LTREQQLSGVVQIFTSLPIPHTDDEAEQRSECSRILDLIEDAQLKFNNQLALPFANVLGIQHKLTLFSSQLAHQYVLKRGKCLLRGEGKGELESIVDQIYDTEAQINELDPLKDQKLIKELEFAREQLSNQLTRKQRR